MRRVVRSGIAIAAVAVLGGVVWGFWSGFHMGSEPPEQEPSVEATQGPESEAPARPRTRPYRLPLPDQPGWKQRPSADEYGMGKGDFLVAYHKSRGLVEPKRVEGNPDLVQFDSFEVAALPLRQSPEKDGAFEEIGIWETVSRTLKEARVPAFGHPVLLLFPENADDPATWEDQSEVFVGIAVLPGALVPQPLRVLRVPKAEAIEGEPRVRKPGADPSWAALVGRARALGRDVQFPLLVRYSGWRKVPEPIVVSQEFVLLKPAPGRPASPSDP